MTEEMTQYWTGKAQAAKTLALIYEQIPECIDNLEDESEKKQLQEIFRKLEAHLLRKLMRPS